MKTTKPRTLSFLLGATVIIGPPSFENEVHSESPSQTAPALVQEVPPETPVPNSPANDESTSKPKNLVEELTDVATLQTNDPFANTFAMLKRAAADNPVTSPLSALTGSSDLQLRGTVTDAADTALALIEIGKTGVHVVRVGDTLSLSGGGRRANVTILAIHRQSVEVEYGNFEDSIIIR